jgi:hypothetical protein
MNAKPIFLVRMPKPDDVDRDKYIEMSRDLESRLNDYHVLVAFDNKIETAVFECFNAKDATEIDIESLRKEFNLL